MKYCKFLLLALCLTSVTVQAETIDGGGSISGIAGAAGTATKACVKTAFIKRNSGTLVTGLTTAKLKPFNVIETSFSPTTAAQITKNFSVIYTLAASTSPLQAGVYDFCITPKVGFVWKKPPNVSYFYSIDAVILGTVAADNGIFSVIFR